MTRTRSYTRFMVGEIAPTPAEVMEGVSVPNDLGNIMLKPDIDASGYIKIDTSVEPPVLQLDKAPVTLLFGETITGGLFRQYENELATRYTTASGTYAGAGSVLKIY